MYLVYQGNVIQQFLIKVKTMQKFISPRTLIAKTLVLTGISALSLLIVTPAQAAFFKYNIMGTFNDGANISGSFDFDSALTGASAFQNIQLTTSNGIIPGQTHNVYNNYTTSPDQIVFFSNSAANYELSLQFLNASWISSPSTFGNLGSYENLTGGTPATQRFITGTVTSQAVPEPLTILGSVIALGFGSTLKRKLAQSKTKKKD